MQALDKIMVAEDDESTRIYLQATLKRHGYEVVLAPDGACAWQLLQTSGAPSLLLLNWHMPGLTGGELCELIRADEALRASYIIILTGQDYLEGMQEAFASGADDYLTKPFNLQELLLRVSVGKRILGLQAELAERIASLRKSEHKYRSIFENIVDIFYRIDAGGLIEIISPSGLRLLGYTSAAELVGRPIDEVLDDAPDAAELFGRIIRSQGAVVNYPLKLRHRDGSMIEVETNARQLLDKHGNFAGVEGLFRDVTQQRLAEKTLRESREQYHRLFDLESDALFLIARSDGQILDANSAAVRLYGYSRQELLNMHDYDLSDPLQQSDLACQYNGQPTRWHRRKDGSLFPVEITASHFKWQNTEVHLAAIRDITDRIRLEDSLKTQNQILESAQRELEQTNLDLIRSYAELKETQAKVMQQEKMVSIGQLAAGMAHEINNPVGFIISNLGTLAKYASRLKGFIEESLLAVEDSALRASIAQRKAELKIDAILDDIDDLIKESLEGAGRVKRLVLDLKSFSRVDEVEYKHADINECIESTLNIVWNELKYKAKVVKHLSELPQIKCYPQQLNQVFMNILVNAAHAIEKQGTITIATSRAGDEIEIRISDTGCGIAPEIAQRIFEPFFTTKEVGKGTGLGLSITYGIVKKHGGDITVESEPGRGSTFIVKLPIVEER